MAKRLAIAVMLLAVAGWPRPAAALERVFEDPQHFIGRHFAGSPPEASFLYPNAELRQQIRAILHHDYPRFRIRYWAKEGATVWLLEEIGKELPITVGLAVNASKLTAMRVLIFRESRGWEVKYDSFANQFSGARLTAANKLDRGIDGITGATLSVRAVTKLARLALLLHESIAES